MRIRRLAGIARRKSIALQHVLTGKSRKARERLDGSCAAILMYHRVLPRDEATRRAVEPGMYVSPETFACHTACLDEFFSVLPLHEIVTRIRDRRPLPAFACAITFDDGWRDNLEHALPALEARGLPATIFAVTGRVGTRAAFWPDEVSRRLTRLESGDRQRFAEAIGLSGSSRDGAIHAILEVLKHTPEVERIDMIDKLRQASSEPLENDRELLDWDELSQLSKRGVDIEAHGFSHAILTKTSRDHARGELAESLRSLRERGHGKHGLLAYPSGEFDSKIVQLARDIGYAGAVTTQSGLASQDCDPLTLPRIGLHEDISSSRLEFLRWVPGSAGLIGPRLS